MFCFVHTIVISNLCYLQSTAIPNWYTNPVSSFLGSPKRLHILRVQVFTPRKLSVQSLLFLEPATHPSGKSPRTRRYLLVKRCISLFSLQCLNGSPMNTFLLYSEDPGWKDWHDLKKKINPHLCNGRNKCLEFQHLYFLFTFLPIPGLAAPTPSSILKNWYKMAQMQDFWLSRLSPLFNEPLWWNSLLPGVAGYSLLSYSISLSGVFHLKLI